MESTKTYLIRPSIHVSRREALFLEMFIQLLLLTVNGCWGNLSGGPMGWRIVIVDIGRRTFLCLSFSLA